MEIENIYSMSVLITREKKCGKKSVTFLPLCREKNPLRIPDTKKKNFFASKFFTHPNSSSFSLVGLRTHLFEDRYRFR